MSSTKTNHTRVLLESDSGTLYSVAFHPDGMNFFGGTKDGIRRWRFADCQEVGKQTGMNLNTISVSRDGKRIVCGFVGGANVWDAELQRRSSRWRTQIMWKTFLYTLVLLERRIPKLYHPTRSDLKIRLAKTRNKTLQRSLTNSRMEHIRTLQSWRMTATIMTMLSLRSSCPRAHPLHYSTTTRYEVITSFVIPRFNNTLEPPSPVSHENSLESGAPAPSSSSANPHSSPGPPMILPVDMPDSTSDNPASPEWNRRTVGEWSRTVMTKRSHNRTPRQTPSDAPPQSGVPSQAKTTPSNEKPSMMAPGKRQQRTVGKSTVRPQKKAAPKPAASQLPKTTGPPHSEAGPAKVPDEAKAEPSGAQNSVEVMVHFVRLAAGTHSNSCNEELGDYRRTTLIFHFPFQCRYPRGFVVPVQTIAVERIKIST
jgi:hypothetical protein